MTPALLQVKTFLRRNDGQSLILAALTLGVLAAFVGLAIDVGHFRAVRRQMQLAADAAALAAGLELRVCGSTVPCNAMSSAVQSSLSENGFTGSTIVLNCASSSSSSVLYVNTPPCNLSSADPNTGKFNYVETVFRRSVPTYFARVLGIKSLTVKTRSEVRRAGAPCVYALNTTAANAISVTAGLTSPCAIVDESTSPSAFNCSAGTVSAPTIKIAGGSSALLCKTAGVVATSAPVPSPADPLKYLTAPAAAACGSSLATPYRGAAAQVLVTTGNVIFYPGTYCGGIKITGLLSNVTFMPGTYTLTSTSVLNGGLSIDLLANVSGKNVTFYNYGPSGGLSIGLTGTGAGHTTLTAPSSGIYGGVLFYQDAANSTAGSVALSTASGVQLQGALYLPAASLSYAAATPGAYTVLVARTIAFTAASTLSNDFSTLTSGSPINADNVQVVE